MSNVLSLPCQPDLAAWAWEIPSLMQTTLTSRRWKFPGHFALWLPFKHLRWGMSLLNNIGPRLWWRRHVSREQSRNKQISFLAFHRHHGCRSSWLMRRGLQAGSLPCQWWNLASTWSSRSFAMDCASGTTGPCATSRLTASVAKPSISSMHSPVQWAVYHRNATNTFMTWRPLCCQKWAATLVWSLDFYHYPARHCPCAQTTPTTRLNWISKHMAFWGHITSVHCSM